MRSERFSWGQDSPLIFHDDISDFDPDQPRDPHGRWTRLEGSHGHDKLISSRNISAKGVGAQEKAEFEKARGQYKRIDIAASAEDEALHQHNVGLFRDRRFYPGMQPGELKGKSTAEVAEAVRNRMADNLVFLASKVREGEFGSKQDFENWRHWYEGAHTIADQESRKAGIDVASATGVIAALSPQNDWNTNVRQAQVVMDALHSKRDMPWDKQMDDVAKRIWSKGAMTKQLPNIRGRSLRELEGDSDIDHQRMAMWVRTEDEAHSDRSYRVVRPDGTFGDVVKTDAGNNAVAAWKATSAITNAVAAHRSGGDLHTLSDAMGEKHKVRSFYNNILDPNSKNADVTIDTHAVGAAWLTPSTQSDVPVVHNLHSSLQISEQPEGYRGAKGSVRTGVKGTYPIYADAYREAARRLGVLPRELQSITWEAKQRLFSAKQTGPKVKAAVDEVWNRFNRGKIDIDEARRSVLAAARGSVG